MLNKINIDDTLFGQYYKRIPEYRPDMYKDGWKPWEVYVAFRRQMDKQIEERQKENAAAREAAQQPEAEPLTVRGEVYVNGKKI